MITVTDLSLNYSGTPLFSHVDLQFLRGNCYGIIGANGAGKSTFLKILSGELDSTSGEVNILPNIRMSVLKQDQNAYDAYNVMDTVIMGNQRLYDIGKEKEALYAKEEMTEEDIERARLAHEREAENPYSKEKMKSYVEHVMGNRTEVSSDDLPLESKNELLSALSAVAYGRENGFEIRVEDGYMEMQQMLIRRFTIEKEEKNE